MQVFQIWVWYTCYSDMGLIYMLFRSGSDLGRPMGSLLGSLLKYNALEDFQEVFQTTSRKSSRRLPGSLLTKSSSISSGVQACLCRWMIYNSFVCGMFCDLHVYSFSCDVFCKFEEILINFFGKYVHILQYYLAKITWHN